MDHPTHRRLAVWLLGMLLLGGGWAVSGAGSAGHDADPDEVEAVPAGVIGRRPGEWQVGDWIGSPPLTLAGLRGKVVLIRWWTAPACPYCRATAPALVDFSQRYRADGLVVLGFYHHKGASPLDLAAVARQAQDFGFEFPVAVDHGWRTLRRWWLDRSDAGWTSVSFLLDRAGVVRHVHPGGEYVAGDPAHREMQAWIEKLLREAPPATEP